MCAKIGVLTTLWPKKEGKGVNLFSLCFEYFVNHLVPHLFPILHDHDFAHLFISSIESSATNCKPEAERTRVNLVARNYKAQSRRVLISGR